MSDWGGFTAITDVERVMDFQGMRRWRLLVRFQDLRSPGRSETEKSFFQEEILRHDADLIALEELDEYSSFFQPALHLFGYEVSARM
jgi:hypothetical protein